MTENEAIEIIKGINEVHGNLPEDGNDIEIALIMAKDALKEIQEYRATGLSPSMVEDLKKSEKKAHKDAMKNAMKLEEYEALGAVDELTSYVRLAENLSICDLVRENARISKKLTFAEIELREAMEKQKAKKPYVEKQKSTGLRGDYDCYECPNCDSFLAVKSDADSDENYRTNYCPYCGQKIDWSVGNE